MTKTNINPVNGYLLIEPKKQNRTTESGIVLPESNSDKPQEGTVLAVGGSVFHDGHEVVSPVKVGDMVIYGGWNNKEYKENGVNLLIVKFEDVMATIK